MKSIVRIFLLILFAAVSSAAAAKNPGPKVVEHLGEKVPLDVQFKDIHGNNVKLKDIITGSTVLDFAYYHCPAICTPLMAGIADVMNKVDLKAGEDYNVISISMDETETPEIARRKKNDMMKLLDKEITPEAWLFLTGDSAAIARVTNAAGFYFKRHGEDFVHTGVLIFISSNGKICRYLYPSYSRRNEEFGILPFDFQMANMETAEGKEMPVVGKILQFCFSYDPQGKTYVLNLLKIFGAGILLLAAGFVIFFIVKPKKRNLEAR